MTSFKPISADASALEGACITTDGGFAAEYPVPNAVTLISVIAPLNIAAVAVAPVPPAYAPVPSTRLSTI